MEEQSNKQPMIDISKVTRFEVINHAKDGQGREYVKYGVKVELSLQDDGRTLKVFLSDRAEQKEPN